MTCERVGEGINNQLYTDGKMLAVTPKYNPTIYINHNENKSAYIMELWDFVLKNNNKNKLLGVTGAHGIMWQKGDNAGKYWNTVKTQNTSLLKKKKKSSKEINAK